MIIEEKIKELGYDLPVPPQPLGSYVPCIKIGNLLFLSGILPLRNGKLIRKGIVGENITIEEAKEDIKITVINALAIVKSYIGSLNKIKKCVKMTGYIASSKNFFDQPSLLNSASDLLYEIFGEKGKHTRVAIGVNVLPFNAPVELEFIFEVHEE